MDKSWWGGARQRTDCEGAEVALGDGAGDTDGDAVGVLDGATKDRLPRARAMVR